MSFLGGVDWALVGTIVGYVGTAASVAGTVVSAWSSIEAGKQQQKAAEYNAAQQFILGIQEKARRELEARRHREQALRLLSRQKSLYLKAGVAMEGTPLEVIGQTAAEAEMDALIIEKTGQGEYLERLAKMGMFQEMGAGYEYAGYLKAGTTLLTGAASTFIGYGGIPSTKQGNKIPEPVT